MEKENQRIVITKRMLKESMLRLLNEKELDKINVTAENGKIIIKNNVFLAFNYSNEIYINNLSIKININELENYIKTIIIVN